MSTTVDELETWMTQPEEDEHLEFKEAKTQFDFEELAKYCAALSNEGGGRIVLGVTNQRPRRVVGSRAFRDLGNIRKRLLDALRLRIEADEIPHADGRVVVFRIPRHPIGRPIQYQGSHWMRVGEHLVPMTAEKLREKLNEAVLDFSAQVRPQAQLSDLHEDAIARFRELWMQKSGNERLGQLDVPQLLADAELMRDGQLTNAALILLGTRAALARHQLANAEVIFEYRGSDEVIQYEDRENFREGFLLFADRLWEKINLRNTVHQVQVGLFRMDVLTFNERAVREALLNAVTHRDYQDPGLVFLRQYPRKLVIESPGGFLPGITVQNILQEHRSRNRLIAESLERCGYVERSGQGVRLIFEECIREAKLPPDYSGVTEHGVTLTLWGEVLDDRFLRFLQQVEKETQSGFRTEDLIILDLVHRELPIPDAMKARVPELRATGVLETVGRGRGTRYILSRRFYDFAGARGAYTRRRGLDRETHKELLLKHLADRGTEGSALAELSQVLPELSQRQVQELLKALRDEGRAELNGHGAGAKWSLKSG